MKHDPSTYIGIGKDGFRAIEPRDNSAHEFVSHFEKGAIPTETESSFLELWLPSAMIFGFVLAFLSYFFLLN